LFRAVLVAALIIACDHSRGGTPSPGRDAALLAESLRFVSAPVDAQRTFLLASCTPLEHGRKLAAITDDPDGFSGLSLFVEIEPSASRPRVRAIGLREWSDCGSTWLAQITGRVVLDSSGSDSWLCRADLRATPAEGDAARLFQRSFRIDASCAPDASRSGLRELWERGVQVVPGP
jgi:hypothetical protein